jgi:hypothetical protein
MSKPVDLGADWWLDRASEDEMMQMYAALNLRLAELRVENDKTTSLAPRTASNTVKVVELLQKAEALEKEYREWYTSLPSSSVSATAWIDDEETDLAASIAHPGRVDLYKELSLAYVYNIARSSQILTWTIILRCVTWLGEPLDYRITTHYKTAAQTCKYLIEDIIASIPYFFVWSRDTDMVIIDRIQSLCGNIALKGVSAVFLIWPIYVAISSDFATSSQRNFLRGKLAYIAESVGLGQAAIMLQVYISFCPNTNDLIFLTFAITLDFFPSSLSIHCLRAQ